MNNDLISRSALKEEFLSKTHLTLFELLDLIDNAPTVEPEKVLIANVTFDEEKLKELTDEIVERIKSGEIVLQDERKKGQWIAKHCEPDIVATTGRWFKCSACGFLTAYGTPKFCMNCGSQMTFKEGGR